MSLKMCIWIGLFIGSTAGSWVGALIAHNNWLSLQSFIGGTVGAFVGIWLGYKAYQRY